MAWDLLGLGAVAVDDLVFVPRYPEADSKILVENEERQGGGLTGTALVAAARLGAKTAFMGVLGADELSRYTISELEREGVDCSAVLVRPSAGPVHSTIIVVSSTGQRTILHSHARVQERAPSEVGGALIAQSRALFVDYTTAASAVRACQAARELKVPTIGDLEGIMTAETRALAEIIDHLIINLDYARRLTGLDAPEAILPALDSPQRACVVVTDGERGGWWLAHGAGLRRYEALSVAVVDTTGCGDVFHGVYAACLVGGENLETCVRQASAAAALKATCSGGRAGCPTRLELEQFLAKQETG
ncbi:MAG: PfkB family carbohydrate kinase [Chloroflexi bacterium]|nr:PfkB family carbohydrate kinase [Chloroflexota bacterium]